MAILAPGWLARRPARPPYPGASPASRPSKAPPPRSRASKPSSTTPSPSAPCNPCTGQSARSPRIQRAQRGYPVPDNPAEPARCGFGARLRSVVAVRGALCVGIDAHPELLQLWGCGDDVAGVERFALRAVEALAPVAAVIKPQSAFFERYGSRGMAVLERVLVAARQAGALVLLDV